MVDPNSIAIDVPQIRGKHDLGRLCQWDASRAKQHEEPSATEGVAPAD
jgi:hypothetical protein